MNSTINLFNNLRRIFKKNFLILLLLSLNIFINYSPLVFGHPIKFAPKLETPTSETDGGGKGYIVEKDEVKSGAEYNTYKGFPFYSIIGPLGFFVILIIIYIYFKKKRGEKNNETNKVNTSETTQPYQPPQPYQ